MARLLIGLRLATLRHSLRGMGRVLGDRRRRVRRGLHLRGAPRDDRLWAISSRRSYTLWTLGWLGATP